MSEHIEFDPTDVLAVGTVGEPGSRAFYIQARAGYRTVSLLVEKAQVAALCQRATELLEGEVVGPREAPAELTTPVDPEWRAGQLGLGFDPDRKLAVLAAQALPDDDEGDAGAEDLPSGRFWVRPAQLRAFAERGLELCAGGRPLCPVCGLPMNADGHVCPRKNGKSPVF